MENVREDVRKVLSIASLVALSACAGQDGLTVTQAKAEAARVALEGKFYVGAQAGAPFDPTTGAWNTPDGRGVVLTLRKDGSYQKASQSYASQRGCTSGSLTIEAGMAEWEGEWLKLLPFTGYVQHSDSCQPGRVVEEALRDLSAETLLVDGEGSELLLTRVADGATQALRRL